ncbi:MAG TPA: RNA-binding S4 domain-containing protein [Paludibacter sp.]
METYSLDKKNHIGLSKLLRKLEISLSKSDAVILIIGKHVFVNGITEIREHAKISFGDIVEVKGHKIMIE